MTDDWLRYSNQRATRRQPISERLSKALGFLSDLGVTMEVFSGGQPAKGSGLARIGSVRHDHGNAADVQFYKDGRRLDWARPEDQPIFEEIVSRGRAAGLTGFGAGPGYMRPGSMHLGFGTPGVWGAGGRSANAPSWLSRAFDLGGEQISPSPELANVPTPTFADRPGTGLNQSDSATGIMSAINPATPVSVERGFLSDPSIQANATAQGGAGSIAAAAGSTPRLSYQASQEEMNSMQTEANRARQALDMNMGGNLSLSPSQLSDAMQRREAAMGILNTPAQTKPKTDLASAYGLLGSSLREGGVLGLAGDKILDPDDVLGVGKLQSPAALAVESMPAVDMTASIAGPATARTISTPRRSTYAAPATIGGGLMTPAEADMVRNQEIALSTAGKNKSVALKNALGKIGGGIAGGLLGGPVGALLGGYLIDKLVTGPRGSGTNYFPERPDGGSRGDGKLTDIGREVYHESKQFKDAWDRGGVGLY